MTESGGGFLMQPARFPGRAPIDAYGNGGFRFADMSHRGSILALPSGIHAWSATDAQALSAEDFGRVLAEADEIDLLLLGTGLDTVALAEALRWPLREANI